MGNILIIEDLDNSYTLIKGALAGEHNLLRAANLNEAKSKLTPDIDLAIVDISLPDGTGYEFCDWVRMEKDNHELPIIFLTAKESLDSRLTAFSVGGDDFMAKPFNFLELRVRVNAKLNRFKKQSKMFITLGGIKVSFREQTVHLEDSSSDESLEITPIEFKILSLLMSDSERAFSREELLDEVWGQNIYVYPRSVDAHVSNIRKKLGSKGSLIKSVHGLGYKFSVLPTDISNRKAN